MCIRIKSITADAHPVNPLDSQLGKYKNAWINPNVTLVKPGMKCLMNAPTPVVTTLVLSLEEGISAVCHPDSKPRGAHIPTRRPEPATEESTVCSRIEILSTSTEFSNFAK